MTDFTWDNLDYWQSGEWQVVQERLDDMKKAGSLFNPARENLFAALDAVDFKDVTVTIVGQDPYPDPAYATGVAFAIPTTSKKVPDSLETLLKEYNRDLGLPIPSSVDLSKWTKQGVLLWNAIPSCAAYKSKSHNWTEWTYLTKEIVERLSERGIVFVFLGGVAREFVKYVSDASTAIELAHPAAGRYQARQFKLKHPFEGSRIFSTVNVKLRERGLEQIDWRL